MRGKFGTNRGIRRENMPRTSSREKNRDKSGRKNRYSIPNLKKAFEVLEAISDSSEGLSFPKLLERINCNKTSLFRILLTIEEMGYIRKNPETDNYFISRKMLSLAYASLCDANLIEESIDIMRQLRDETSETTMLGVLLDDECVMIAQEYGDHDFNFTGKLGMKSPLHASAPGKAILAALPDAEREKLIARIKLTKNAENTITDRGELKAELAKIAARNYATDASEAVNGVNCVASNIFDAHGYPVAVIWITAPANRILARDFDLLGERVRAKAMQISERLGLKK